MTFYFGDFRKALANSTVLYITTETGKLEVIGYI